MRRAFVLFCGRLFPLVVATHPELPPGNAREVIDPFRMDLARHRRGS